MKNRGKQFEGVIRESFLKVPDVSIDRIHDQTTKNKGSSNICDFIVYKKPHEYYIECKSIHGNTFPLSNITDTQWKGLLKKSQILGVHAGIICWWIDKDVTKFLPIQLLEYLKTVKGKKSIRYDFEPFDRNTIICNAFNFIEITGKKKRILFDYDMEQF